MVLRLPKVLILYSIWSVIFNMIYLSLLYVNLDRS